MPPPSTAPLRIDVYSIRLFIAVAQAGSISRAAERENIATSALSRRLADLEHALQVPLIIRSARGIELTEAGKFVYESGQRLESDLLRLAQGARDISGSVSGSVRLYANPSSIVGALPERLRAFSDRYPEVSIELSEARSRDVVRACIDDRADVGVAVAVEVSKGMDSWRLLSDALVVLMPSRHFLAARERLRFVDVLGNGLVGIHAGGAMDQTLKDAALLAQMPFKPKVTVESFDAACRMVQAGLGLAIIPTSAATAFAGTSGFLLRPLDEPWAARELRIYALQKQPRPRAVDALIALLRQ